MATLFDNDTERGPMTAPLVVVRLAGDPEGKGRPRARIVTPRGKPSFVSVYTPQATRDYEDRLRAAAIDAMAGRPLLEGPLDMTVFAFFPIPESWSIKKREAALAGDIRPTVKPDWENIGKLTDAFNPVLDRRSKIRVRIVWGDDAQVVDGRVIKHYAKSQPGIVVEIRQAGPPIYPHVPKLGPAESGDSANRA